MALRAGLLRWHVKPRPNYGLREKAEVQSRAGIHVLDARLGRAISYRFV